MNVSAKVQPPGAYGAKVGLFATRTPHRPNPIGLSLVRIVGVSRKTPAARGGGPQKEGKGWNLEGAGPCRLHVAGCDLIEGTPVIDVKPYLGPPLDGPSCDPSNGTKEEGTGAPASGGGSSGASQGSARDPGSCGGYRVAPWVRSGLKQGESVRGRIVCDVELPWDGARADVSEEMAASISLLETPAFWRSHHHDGLTDWAQAVKELLQLDIRSVWQGRGGKGKSKTAGADRDSRYQEYEMEYDGVGMYVKFHSPPTGAPSEGHSQGPDASAVRSRPWVVVESIMPRGLPRTDGAVSAEGTL